MSKITYRMATVQDIPFLVDTIIEAEKSGTDILSYTTIFGLSEFQTREFISKMLAEEIDGCELSISSFLLAEVDGQTAGAVAAWLEGVGGTPSSLLKGNLLNYTLPKSVLKKARGVNSIIKTLYIENIYNTIQIGLVYVEANHRGQNIVSLLIDKQINNLVQLNTHPEAAYVQVFGGNDVAIRAYEKAGFRKTMTKDSNDEEILKYMPANTKILMKREL